MGILDHRKTWHFSVKANDKQCLQAFRQAMVNPGFKLAGARWTVEESLIPVDPGHNKEPEAGCIATYQGRGGVAGIVTALGNSQGQARIEEQNAIGSQVLFTIDSDSTGSKTNCSMWLSSFKTGVFNNIADARFIRGSMNDVEKRLRQLDPMLSVNKV